MHCDRDQLLLNALSRRCRLAVLPAPAPATRLKGQVSPRSVLFVFRFTLICLLAFSPATARAEYAATNQWSLRVDDKSDSSPAVAPDGTIYFGTFRGKLWAILPHGVPKWTFQAGREIRSSPAVGADGTIYFGCRDRKLYALRPDGKKAWEFKTGAWVDSSPAIATDGTVYVGSWDGNLYALNSDGSKRWTFTTGGPVVSSPAIGLDGTIYFGSHDGKFYALTPAGQKKWEYATGGPILSSPAINGDQCLYFTSADGFFHAVNLDGSLRWRLHTGGTTESSPVIGVDGVIFVGVNHEIWAILPDGKQKWPRGTEDPIEASPIALADRSVACIPVGGRLIVLDEKREPQWAYYTRGYGHASPGIAPSGTFYVGHDRAFYFSALQARVALASSPWPKFHGNSRNTGNLNDIGSPAAIAAQQKEQ